MVNAPETARLPPVMKAVEIEKPGGPEVLKPVERPVPRPGRGEVLIRVAAAGVNRPDILQRMGLYPPPPGASDLPGLEVAGEIAAVGEQAGDWKPGDLVCALLPGGGYAQFALAHYAACLPSPKGLTLYESASLPETMFTVWANVFDDAALNPGETLLAHGGASGIGATAIALAKAFGAKVFTTAGSAEKCAAAKDLGADAAFNYREDDWSREIAGMGGADVVLDIAGGDFVARNLQCLNPGGRHVSIAFLRGATAEISIPEIMQKRLRLSGSTLRNREPGEKARIAADLRAEVWPLIEAGRVRPTLDKVYPLAAAGQAHQRMEAGAHVGKIVLDAT
ncbi:MAG: NAD(P)H-quinone oxidoreductase [Parvularculaceae bacterium]